MALRRGETIGTLRIEECLGQGGFAFTYKAWDTFLNRWVAIKELFRPESVRRRGAAVVPVSNDLGTLWEWRALLRKFTEEARHLAKFRHPNIVTVINSHEANNTAYIVMQYVEGRTLNEYLNDLGRPIKEAELRRLLDQILNGLEAVHKAQLLHRDIKPSNIYLTRDNQVVLLDFGAARPEGERSGKSTLIFYTDGYSPPEQYTSTEPLRPASDIYATAATLVRAVTRQEPPSVPQRLVTDTYRPLAARYRGQFSTALLSAIDAGMALKSSDRPASIAKWRRMFNRPSRKANKPQRRQQQRRLDPSLLLLAAFVCLVIAFTAIWMTIRMSSDQGQPMTAWIPEEASAPDNRGLTAATPPAPQEAKAADTAPLPAAPPAKRAPPLVAKAPPIEPHPEAAPSPKSAPAAPSGPVPPVVAEVVAPGPVEAPSPSALPPAMPSTAPVTAAPSSRPEPVAERPAAPQAATPADNLESTLNSFLKAELEQPMRPPNYAPRLRVNDSGKAGDTRAITVEELLAEEQKDEARYVPRPGQFTHLGSKLVSHDSATDTVLMRQVFCYDRVLKENNKRFLGIIIREVRMEKAGTTQRRITGKIVTARAGGYRCRLSAADHQGIPPAATTALAKIRAILQRDRENYALGRQRDEEDLAFQDLFDEAGRAKMLRIEDSKTVLIPGGVDSETTILNGTPVVDVYVDLEDSAPAVVIVVRQ